MIKKLHNLYKIPFYIGGVISWFVFGRYNRRRVRGNINVLLYRFQIAKFIKQTFGEKTKKIRLVRQVSMNRMTCIVNDRYYVKIFRDFDKKLIMKNETKIKKQISNMIDDMQNISCNKI